MCAYSSDAAVTCDAHSNDAIQRGDEDRPTWTKFIAQGNDFDQVLLATTVAR